MHERNGNADSLTGQKPHDTPVSGKDGQFHQVTEHAEDLQEELLPRKYMQSRYPVSRVR